MGYSTLQATEYRGAPTRAHTVDKADILRNVHLIFSGETLWYIIKV